MYILVVICISLRKEGLAITMGVFGSCPLLGFEYNTNSVYKFIRIGLFVINRNLSPYCSVLAGHGH